MSVEALIDVSRFYGKNPEYVLAGGGNTSWKDGETLYIKGSGVSLADVTADSFVKMDRKALAEIWNKHYPESSAERESAVLADMMAARKPEEEQKRPSVETVLHDLLPFAYVVHLHPARVNGLTCSRRGEDAMKEIFGDEAIWIASENPGYILSRIVKTSADSYASKHGKKAALIFLQNHGIFAGDDTVEGIKEKYDSIMKKIGNRIKKVPDFSDEKRYAVNGDGSPDPAANEVMRVLSEIAGASAFMTGNCFAGLVKNCDSFAPVSSAFSPDHIVYAGSDPLFTGARDSGGLKEAWEGHVQKTGLKPKIVAVEGLGIFAAGATEKAVNLSLELFRDAVKVAVYSESFGGPLFMTRDKIDFINNWELEHYRSKVSA